MRYLKSILLTLVALTIVAAPAVAQSPTATPVPIIAPDPATAVDPNANIIWPVPVYVVRGVFEIHGSANLADQVNYFLEFRALNPDLTPQNERIPWLPVSLPSNNAVLNDVLAEWNTTTVRDGVYELRLTINRDDIDPYTFTVRPLRIENNPPPFVQIPTNPPFATQAPQVLVTATFAPTLIPTADNVPRATVNVANANVREGDTTFHRVINSFSSGTSLEILGISSNNTGWYLVQLPDGRRGWIASSVVTVSGNTSGLPRVAPPPPPVTPTPTFTPTPIAQGNLVAGVVVFDPAQPRCGQTFSVNFDVANLGTGPTAASGIVSLADVRTADGSIQGTTVGGFPVLQPGQTFRVVMPLTISTFYAETHTIVLQIDPNNALIETNEGDNRQSISYTLRRADC